MSVKVVDDIVEGLLRNGYHVEMSNAGGNVKPSVSIWMDALDDSMVARFVLRLRGLYSVFAVQAHKTSSFLG